MAKILVSVNSILWGAPALLLILGVGLYLMVRLRLAPLRLLPRAVRRLVRSLGEQTQEGISPVQALCTALAATVGTGNLVGVAGALCLGGPGAIFWMWICGTLGMATKYAETVLAVRFRIQTEEGCAGGPMYVMTRGLGEAFRPMAKLYAFFGIIAAFGVGNAAQIGSAVTAVTTVFPSASKGLTGLLLAAALGPMLLGGARRIGKAAAYLVPFAAGGYILLCAAILAGRWERVPEAFSAIIQGAFSPRAVTGGMIGSAFAALRTGCSRGVFTNEAGMGTASMAHAGAQVPHPADQGLMGILEVFLDTIVICTLTALTILVSGVPIHYGTDTGAELVSLAFSQALGNWAGTLIALFLTLFACATVLGWGLYGGCCAQFLFGSGSWKWFSAAQILVILLSAAADTASVWLLAETANGLMALPNLLTLAALTPEVIRLTKEYITSGDKRAGGGTYANFHQRKPLRTLTYEKIPPSGRGG